MVYPVILRDFSSGMEATGRGRGPTLTGTGKCNKSLSNFARKNIDVMFL
jgi:hypothetical protein